MLTHWSVSGMGPYTTIHALEKANYFRSKMSKSFIVAN